jgi:hypothetical protein
MNSISDFSPLAWYRRVVTLGYDAIFPGISDSLWIWHLILYDGLGLIMTAWVIIRLKEGAAGPGFAEASPRRNLFGIGLMAFAFLTAFLASMTTLIVSSYFPPYAIWYPSLLLVAGLAFSFWFILDGAAMVMDLIASSTKLSRFAGIKLIIDYGMVVLPMLVTIALIGTVTVRAWPSVSAGYCQIMEQNRVRRHLYAEIVKLRDTTGQRYFILMNLWKAPIWGLHMDEAWGRAAYFRWRGMEDIICLTEDEWTAAGRSQEQMYFKLDYAKMIQDQSDRKR